MFNLDTNAMAAQIAAKSTAEKKAFQSCVAEYNAILEHGDHAVLYDFYDRMVSNPDISVQSFVAFFLYANM